jgi:SAM-dependent methyltransferase
VPAAAATREAWSRYWASGAPQACSGSFDGNDGGAIAARWRQVFAALPAGARVLDIGCGNGPLARLLLDRDVGRGLHYDGIDAAQIAPAWAAERPELHWHPGQVAEALPFDDASFDLVASQYGIEYAELPRASAEAVRVCRPGGALGWLLHHVDSRPCTLARDERRHLAWLLEADGFLARGQAMLEPMSLLGRPEAAARLGSDRRFQLVRAAFEEVSAQLAERHAAAVCPDVLDDARIGAAEHFRLAATRGHEAALRSWRGWRAALADADSRLQDMLLHALDEAAVQRLVAHLGELGVQASVSPLHEREHLMGWFLAGRRRE